VIAPETATETGAQGLVAEAVVEPAVEAIVEENASKEITEVVQSPAKIEEVLSTPLVQEKEVV